jgi:hypothetical protein
MWMRNDLFYFILFYFIFFFWIWAVIGLVLMFLLLLGVYCGFIRGSIVFLFFFIVISL